MVAALLLFVVLVVLNFMYDAEDQIDAGAADGCSQQSAFPPRRRSAALISRPRRLTVRSVSAPCPRAVLEEEGVVFDTQMESIEREVLTALETAGKGAVGRDAIAIGEMVEDALTFDGYGGEDEEDGDHVIVARRRRLLLLGGRRALGAAGGEAAWGYLLRYR